MDYILNEYHRNISNQELLNDIKSTAEKLNKKVLTQDEYSRYGKYSPNTVQRRFGGWNKALLLCGMCPNAYQLGAAKSKPLSYCYWNSVINASSTFITLRCPSGESVFKRSESSVARSIVAAFKLS